jgi:hypothetical protein
MRVPLNLNSMLCPGSVSLTIAGRRFAQRLAKASAFRSAGASPAESFAAVIGTSVACSTGSSTSPCFRRA